MGFERFPGRPCRLRAAAAVTSPAAEPLHLALLCILALCLALAGCQTDEIVEPPGGDDGPDGPVCGARVAAEIVLPAVEDGLLYPPRLRFEWRRYGDEPIAYSRHLLVELEPGENGIELLNEDPARFEESWTEWERWLSPGGSFLAGEEERLRDDSYYLFAVQTMDGCGRVTETFSGDRNARWFRVRTICPQLTVTQSLLGGYVFYGTLMRPPAAQVPPGVPYGFRWSAEPTYSWFGPSEYRWGWDVQNLEDPDEWACDWRTWATGSWPKTFVSGVHVFYVEARDEAGTVTRARVEIEVIPFPMDRPLLWIDDWQLGEQPDPLGIYPTETQHDEFWTGLCSLVPGFDPQGDVLEAALQYNFPIPLSALSRYRNVIWTYSNTHYNSWEPTIRFIPETCFGCPWPRQNSLRLFLAAGGNALTCGAGMNGTGLAATFEELPLFPVDVVREIAPYREDGGLWTMAHDDYYVTVIDQVVAPFRTDLPAGVVRAIERDGMRYAQEATGIGGDLPPLLELRDEVTAPGMWWDPAERGFNLVEAYDPAYYMEWKTLSSHRCFTPMYLMRTRSTLSPLDYAPVAIWTLDQECENPRFGPYRPHSAHFGLPLWYIKPEQSGAIVRHLFERWGIWYP